jgi:hypothetical protein
LNIKIIKKLIRFIIQTPNGASTNGKYTLWTYSLLNINFLYIARFKALEIVSANIDWLLVKEKEIEQAFNPRGLKLGNKLFSHSNITNE